MKPKSTKTAKLVGLIRPEVRALKAYRVDETPVRIKLDAMENPFSLPGSVQKQLASVLREVKINLYPDPSGKELKESIASLWKMDPDLMILGNGSDELIQAIILAFGGPVLVPVPTFAMYEITSRALAQPVVTVPLGEDFDLDAGTLIKKARQSKARVIFLASPNNPTGNRFSDKAVKKILDNTTAAVVIDEAYYSFSGKSWLPQLNKYPNMIILRTLSKIGFAGLRVGVLTASPGIVNELNKIRLPYNINSLSQAAGVSALKHRTVINRQISTLISERKKLYNVLSRMPGITAYPSETNFILLRTTSDASVIQKEMKGAGILIKDLNGPGPLKNCLRVTIGTPEENREFLRTLKTILDTA
ncbi:MAG: histidinol-phosphate transaminase [Nitrospirae bacterium GWD2_57_9]|nr:MAG: histidinol-phosphate transaminase [Nitrospirae bacterium GWD2_57_9]